MINVYVERNAGSTTVRFHQGEGTLDETAVMESELGVALADTFIGDLLVGAVTVHGVGA
jgi:hypothetical protein